MAQNKNLFPSLPPGRYDGVTFYMRNGKLIGRRSTNVRRNPSKTLVQSATRLRWNNVQRLWNEFPQGWRPHFQNRPVGWTDYNSFMSLNMHGTPIYFTKSEVKCRASVLVPLVVSTGILGEIAVSTDNEGLLSDIKVGDFVVTPQTTVAHLSRAVMRNNRDYCQGDQLTFLVGRQEMGNGVPQVRFEFFTVVLDLLSDQLLAQAVGGHDGFEVRSGVLASRVTTGAATWVHSRIVADGERAVSSQQMWCNNGELVAQYTSLEALQRAAESYGLVTVPTLTPNPTFIDTAGRL